MSAFIVNKKHIDYILSTKLNSKYDYPPLTEKQLTKIGQILVNENFKSVNYRYHENFQPYKYNFQPVINFNPIQALKAIDCLDYQSCKHEGWKKSRAKRILEDIKDSLITMLPGYDDFHWEVS